MSHPFKNNELLKLQKVKYLNLMRLTHQHGDHIGMKKKDGDMLVATLLPDFVVVKGKLTGRRSYSSKWNKKSLKLSNRINKLNEDELITFLSCFL